MPQLLVRSIDKDLIGRLKARAAFNNHSAEAEHRLILQQALQGTQRRSLAEILTAIPNVGVEADFERIK